MCVCGQEISNISNRTLITEKFISAFVTTPQWLLVWRFLFRFYSVYFHHCHLYEVLNFSNFAVCFVCLFLCLSACLLVHMLYVSLSFLVCLAFSPLFIVTWKKINEKESFCFIKTFARSLEYEYSLSWWTMFTEIEEIAFVFEHSFVVVQQRKDFVVVEYVDFCSFLWCQKDGSFIEFMGFFLIGWSWNSSWVCKIRKLHYAQHEKWQFHFSIWHDDKV